MSKGERFVCIHGHFYQPPREHPWLQVVEAQDSAAPYHDWNERVTAECYEPNSAARVLDAQGRIVSLRNNYSAISFNFGPTLLAWLERAYPELYAAVVDSDRAGAMRYGRGNAIAQVYGHVILPLADPRDRVTQVRWGIADFVHRFGRAPEGMWLPETAVDETSLRVLADHGIRFTILAPHQARRVSYAGGPWQDVHGEGIDPSRPYLCELGEGKSIVVFFYDGAVSRGIAFEGWLADGRALAEKITARALGFQEHTLLHVAADGETYGHHHRFGEMALAAALDTIEKEGRVRLTNYAAYLQQVTVKDRVHIRDYTSWSCAHGVERWRSGCPCNAGHAGWQHDWRAPLREALDWLKERLDALFEHHAAPWLRDPWEARNAYVTVLLKRTQEAREEFLRQHARAALTPEQRSSVWKLLEMQRHAMLMFTSCGWFFDDPTGLETTQILTYAARAAQLAAEFGPSPLGGFLERLRPMRSNLADYPDGVAVFDRLVRPRISDRRRVVAHYAMNALFDPPPAVLQSYVYQLRSRDRVFDTGGTPSFVAGNVEVREEPTEEREAFDYAAVHLGGHDFLCVVDHESPLRDQRWRERVLQTFRTQTLADVLRELEASFANGRFTLADVFAAERRQILGQVTGELLVRASRLYERIVADHRRLIEFLVYHRLEIPEELRIAMRFVVQRQWEQRIREFAAGEAEFDEVAAIADDAARWGVELDQETAAQVLGRALAEAVECIAGGRGEECLQRARAVLLAGRRLAIPVEMRKAQNVFFRLWQREAAAGGVRREDLRELGAQLGFAVDALGPPHVGTP